MWLYSCAIFLFRIWLFLCGCKIEGRENIPQKGRLILVGNHTSYADPILMACAAKNRQVYFIGKEELFHLPVLGSLFRYLGAFPVKRGQVDVPALKKCLAILNNEKALGVFAEGKRNLDEQVGEFKQGAAFIAYKTDAPILPVAIFNAHDFGRFWKRNLRVIVGRPFLLKKEGKSSQEIIAGYTNYCREEIQRLLSEGASR